MYTYISDKIKVDERIKFKKNLEKLRDLNIVLTEDKKNKRDINIILSFRNIIILIELIYVIFCILSEFSVILLGWLLINVVLIMLLCSVLNNVIDGLTYNNIENDIIDIELTKNNITITEQNNADNLVIVNTINYKNIHKLDRYGYVLVNLSAECLVNEYINDKLDKSYTQCKEFKIYNIYKPIQLRYKFINNYLMKILIERGANTV